MTQRLYSIKDIRSHQFGIPFVAINDDIAKRTTASTLMGVPPTHLMYAFASDYELYYLGEVMDDGRLVTAETGPEAITFLSDLIQAYKVNEKRGAVDNAIQFPHVIPENKDAE